MLIIMDTSIPQMGDLNTMRANEYMNLTLHHKGGVQMHCIPRRTLQ